MALKINPDVETFCPLLFRTLDHLGLLPIQLGWKRDKFGRPQSIAPTEFEKHSRALVGAIRRYNDVATGFEDWASRILRQEEVKDRKEKLYPELAALRQWMVEHKTLFTDKATMQHLNASLYARVFNYLYPRRVLANTYCIQHQGNPDALAPEFVAREFPQSILGQVQKVAQVYEADWDIIVADVRENFTIHMGYYSKMVTGKEKPEIPEELLVQDQEEVSND